MGTVDRRGDPGERRVCGTAAQPGEGESREQKGLKAYDERVMIRTIGTPHLIPASSRGDWEQVGDSGLINAKESPMASQGIMQTPNWVPPMLGIGLIFFGWVADTGAVSPNFQTVVLADAPVVYYQFNEAQGAATNHGSFGPAFNATYFGTPRRAVGTATGDAGVQFDSPDDYLESVNIAPASLSGNPSFTAEAVFFLPTTGGAELWAPFLHWGVSAGSQAEKTMKSVYFSFSNNDPMRIFAGFYNGGLRTVTAVPRGEWHHLVWVRQGGTRANLGSVLYVDGVSVSLENDPALPTNSGVPDVVATAFRVNRAQDLTRYFTGILDELALYDRALTSEEVLIHYAASTGSARLSIQATGASQVQISWSPAVPGFVLQESLSLDSASWINSTSGGANPINIAATNAAKFYRVFKP